jgi:hypothetical protein
MSRISRADVADTLMTPIFDPHIRIICLIHPRHP